MLEVRTVLGKYVWALNGPPRLSIRHSKINPVSDVEFTVSRCAAGCRDGCPVLPERSEVQRPAEALSVPEHTDHEHRIWPANDNRPDERCWQANFANESTIQREEAAAAAGRLEDEY
jgi:hypothetical protein